MSQGIQFQNIDQAVRAMKIIAGALMTGVILFGVIAVSTAFGKDPADPMMAYTAVGFSVMALVVRTVVPPLFENEQRKRAAGTLKGIADREQRVLVLAPVFQTKMIVEMAVLEGACFFCLVSYMLTAQWWLLAVVGVLLAIMAAGFPTRTRLESWADDQLQLMELE